MPVYRCHFWSNERDLHGDLRWGNNYRLSGSENSPINGVFMKDLLFDAIKFLLIDLENDVSPKKEKVKQLLNALVKEDINI